MKALTVWQPWASLIAIGAKPYEFRGWVPPTSLRGQRIAIHAGARPVRKGEVADLLDRLSDRAEPLCLHADLARPLLERVFAGLKAKPGHTLFGVSDEPFRLPLSAIVCTAVLGEPKRGDKCAAEFGCREAARPLAKLNWGWPMLDVRPLLPPEEGVAGAQGFWDRRP